MALFDRFRRTAEKPDAFALRVAELVATHAPADTLESNAAAIVATSVVLQGLSEPAEREAVGRTAVDVRHSSRMYESLVRSIKPVVERVLSERLAELNAVGALIASTCFGDLSSRPFLDADEVRWLIGVAYGVALDLSDKDPSLSSELLEKKTPPSTAESALSDLERELAASLLEYGRTSDERLVHEIRPLYERAMVELSTEQRMQMLLWLIEQAESRRISGNALMPFVFRDFDWRVVSSAALHLAAIWPESDSDPMIGVRELRGWAQDFARTGDEHRAAAICSGLALLGDRRVLETIGPCWRELSTESRIHLAHGVAGRTHAALIDWLIGWLEECEGGEFGVVAAALARIPTYTQPPEVIEVRRALPVWSVEPDSVITVLQRWSFEEYGLHIRKRLLQIAADEVAPRVMYDVLKSWNIAHGARQAAGVHMRARGGAESPRALLPLLGSRTVTRSDVLESFIPLDDHDFVARDGQLLLCWSIFNPYGPTWSSVGLLPTEDPGIDLLFYRMLNPFGQQSAAVGVVRRGEGEDAAAVSQLVERLFAREVVASADGREELYLIGNGVPDVRIVVWDEADFVATADRAFRLAPRLRDLDVVRSVREIREFEGRPWDRTAAQREAALKRMTSEGLITPLPHEGMTTDAVIDEWLMLVSQQEHWVPELLNFPGAWHGAIDHTSAELAQNAYTFWQLDDFLTRYGFPIFREFAEMLERQQVGDATPAEASVASSASNPVDVAGDANGYRAAYERLRKGWEGLDFENESPSNAARGIAAGMVARQVASAEHHLASVGVDTSAIRRLMHQPWALGYLLGVGQAMSEIHKLTPGSHDAETVVIAAHQSAILNISTAEALHLSNRARERPGFEDGMSAAAQDVIAAMRGDGEADGLFRWLMEEGTQHTS